MQKNILIITTVLFLAIFLCGTVSAADGNTTRVSIASNGTQSNLYSTSPDISADGKYVTFRSGASNLVSGDTNGVTDVFVHNMDTGNTNRVSVASNGTEGNSFSDSPKISEDGTYITFHSTATNLVDGDTNGEYDVFVHNTNTGQTNRVSVSSSGNQGNSMSVSPDISADGNYIVFESDATNLVSGDTNNYRDIFLHNMNTGSTIRVSLTNGGLESNEYSYEASISSDGRYVAFTSSATNLVSEDTTWYADVFVRDTVAGTTELISADLSGNAGNDHSGNPSISADGRYVAFKSLATNLVSGDTNGYWDVFVRDRYTGITTKVSVASNGTQTNLISEYPSINSDGRYVTFQSSASNLVAGDTNNKMDIFVHDMNTGETSRVSVASNGTQANNENSGASISSNGHSIAFASSATNLVEGDTNGHTDVFVHETSSGGVHPGDSIQNAINNASEGDTITVYDNSGTPYTYHESITVNKKLTIVAAGIVTVSGDLNPSSPVFTITSTGSGSTIQGFLITGATNSYGVLIDSTSDCTIKNLTIENCYNAVYMDGTCSNVLLEDLVIRNIPNTGINVFANVDGLTFNRVNIDASACAWHGIYLAGYHDGSTRNWKNVVINNTNISNAGHSGIVIRSSYSRLCDNLTITNCHVTDNHEHGILFEDGVRGNINITGNTVTGNSVWGVRVRGYDNPTANISGNTIANNGNELYIGDASADVHFNRIVGSGSYLLLKEGTGSVNAENNWWGSNSSPSSRISGNVDFDPWLVLNVTADPASIGIGGTSNITADLTHDSSRGYHDPIGGHVPDGIPVGLATSLGTINSPVSLVNGVARATLDSGVFDGVADVSATLDNQTVHTSVNIGTTPDMVLNTRTLETFSTIQDAINDADTLNGDTLNCSAGTFFEHDILVNKDLTISGPTIVGNGLPMAIVDAEHLGRVFKVSSGSTVTLQYLLIQNGNATTEFGRGGGVYNNGTLNLIKCTIINNTAPNSSGGGIYNLGNMTISSTEVYENTANLGGGICNFYTGNVNVTDSNVNNNTAVWGNGGGINSDGTFNLTNSNVCNNTASNGGAGGIYNGGILTVNGSDIYNNIANTVEYGNLGGGGIANFYTGTVTLVDSNIYNNSARDIYNNYVTGGGGICNYGGVVILNGSNIGNNTATGYCYGGGIYNGGIIGGTTTVTFCRIIGNTAPSSDDIYCDSGSVNAENNWWGSNDSPSSRISGNVDFDPWLVMNLTASPTTIPVMRISNLTADFTHNSNGTDTSQEGHIPDGTPVKFTTDLGNVGSKTVDQTTANGVATAVLTADNETGTANISALSDNQTVNTTVSITNSGTLAWIDLNATGPKVEGPACAYDTDRNVAVVFGGYNESGGVRTDTWEWDGTQWTQINVTGPGARVNSQMAYDALHKEMVMFGGWTTPDNYYGDTWTYNGTVWTLKSTSGPGAQANGAMAYDSARQVVVLYINGATWEWNGTSWTYMTSSGPSSRIFPRMAYDENKNRTVLFGGKSGFYGSLLCDTWEWDGTTWTQVASTGPDPRDETMMAYNPDTSKIVLYGGGSWGNSLRFNDTWEWNGSNWSQLNVTGSLAISNGLMFFDEVKRYVVISSGMTSDSVPQNRTYALTGAVVTGNVINNRTLEAFNTIQAAIDDSDTLNGDTLTAYAASFLENIIVWKQLIITANGVVNVQPANVNLPVFTINSTGSGSTIQGFIVSGATNSHGVNLNSSNGCTIRNLAIENCNRGVYINGAGSNTKLEDLFIQNIEFTGIHMFSDFDGLTINQVTITNTGLQGIYISPWTNWKNLIINNTNVTNSSSTGIEVNGDNLFESTNVTISGCQVSGNQGNGICLGYEGVSGNINITDNTITDNRLWGVELHGRDNPVLNLSGNIFSQNVGGIYLSDLRNYVLNQNIADCNGGIFYQLVNVHNLTLQNCVMNSSTPFNTGVYITGNNTNITLQDLIILNPQQRGIDIYSSFNGLTINRVNISNSVLQGIYASPWTSWKNMVINNTIVTNSNSTGIEINGYNLYECNNVTISRCQLSDNQVNGIVLGYEGVRGNINITYNTITGNQLWGVELHGRDNPLTNITGNTITNNNGIAIYNSPADIHFNRIVGSATLLYNNGAGFVNAENNWWGSNANPSTHITGSNLDYDPWIVMNLTANPTSIFILQTSNLTADFTHNSNGTHTSQEGHIPDGTPVKFTTDLGNVGSKTVAETTVNGVAQVILTADMENGTAHLSAETDNQTVNTIVIVNPVTGNVVNSRTLESFNTIQAAIDDSDTLNGDTLTAYATNFLENIIVWKQLIITTNGVVNVHPADVNLPVFSINSSGGGSTIQGFNITGGSNGIKLESASDCLLNNNNITGNSFAGIYLYESSHNNLTNNNIHGNPYGIFSEYGDNNTITSNQITQNPYAGVVLRYWSDQNLVSGNTVNDNGYGLHLLYSSGNTIQNNQITSNDFYGIYMDNSQNNQLENNIITDNRYAGAALYFSANNNTFSVNNVTGNGFGFYLYNSHNNRIGLNIFQSAEISNNLFYGIYLDNSTQNIIGNCNIKNNLYAGVALYFNSNNNSIGQNTIQGNGFGMYMYNSNNNDIQENSIANKFYGIYMDSSTGNGVYANQINNNPYAGVALYFGSNNNTFSVNTLTGNGFAFYISSSDDNQIFAGTGPGAYQNTIQNNLFYGIYLENADGNLIEGNYIAGNPYAGIALNSASTNNTIRQNIGIDNNGFGIYIVDSSANNIYQNSINANTSQAYDNSTNNWDNGTTGNHWSDWPAGVPRAISGGTNTDHYPY